MTELLTLQYATELASTSHRTFSVKDLVMCGFQVAGNADTFFPSK